jgi:DNA invertase Pin-like site-specific DNA recombinase
MNAIIYCRISQSKTSKTNIRDISLDSQEFLCSNYCNDNNIKIIKIVKECCSGRNYDKMNGLKKLARQIMRDHPNTLLIISDLTRFMRNTYQALDLINKLNNKGITVYSVTDKYSYSKVAPSNEKFQFRQLLNYAELESDRLADRQKRSISHRRAIGSKIGKAAFGQECYKDQNGIRKIRPCVKEQLIIKTIQTMLSDKKSYNEIVEYLNTNSFTFRGKLWTVVRIPYIKTILSKNDTKSIVQKTVDNTNNNIGESTVDMTDYLEYKNFTKKTLENKTNNKRKTIEIHDEDNHGKNIKRIKLY